jgi:hypothetical protein
MLKDSTYKDKFVMLQEWMPRIVDEIKKDLRVDHLKADPRFFKQYFPGQVPNKITIKELAEGYLKAIAEEENEALAEFISTRWLLKHTDLYEFFVKELEKIDPNFDELELIEDEKAEPIIEQSLKGYGHLHTYVFCILNSVVFSEKIYAKLANDLRSRTAKEEVEILESNERLSVEKMVKNHERELARLKNRYEKKLSGMQKKYLDDTLGLKKQLANVQRKLDGLLASASR